MSHTESDILELKAQSEMSYASDPHYTLALALQAYSFAEQIGTPHALALGHWTLANAHAFSDDLERVRLSISHYQKASQLFEDTADRYRRARMQIGYVYAMARLNKTERAIAIADEAQPVLKAANDLDGLARLLINLGAAYDIQGNAEKALVIYDRCLLALEAQPQQDFEIGRTHINRAISLLSLNEFAEAEYALELARVSLMQDPNGNAADLAKLDLSLGNARAAQQQYQAAIPAYEQALKRAVTLNQPAQVALVQLFLALAQVNSADPTLAVIGAAMLAAMLPDLAHFGQQDERVLALLGIGRAHTLASAWQSARAVLSEVMVLTSEPSMATLRIQAHLLAAEIAESTGNVSQARLELEQAIAVVEAHAGDVRDEVLRASWFSDKLAPFHRLVRLLCTQGDMATALEIVQQAKARELRRSIESEAGSITWRLHPIDSALADEIAQLRSEVGQLRRLMRLDRWRQEEAGLPISATNDAARDAARKVSQLEERLRQSVAQGNQVLHPQASRVQVWRSAELANTLAPNELLIEYLWAEDCIWAWAVTQRGIVAQRVIANPAEVNTLCDRYIQAIQRALGMWINPAAQRLAAGLLSDVNATGRALYASLILPFRALVSAEMYDTLIIAGDGKLNRIPFHALPQPDGTPLLQTVEVRYVPGAAFARPSVRHSTTRAVGISGAVEHAQQARYELDALQDCFGDVKRFEDEVIDMPKLAEALRTHNWVHLATHAAVHPRDPSLSSFALGMRDVTLAEVTDFDLQQVCVILSACETALGQRKGSDVFSLAHGFMVAGATTLMTSLWRVADTITATLMQASTPRIS